MRSLLGSPQINKYVTEIIVVDDITATFVDILVQRIRPSIHSRKSIAALREINISIDAT